ncbi:hypothetical protein GQ457_18G009740 [Hibiscus cannabinus]
MPAKVADPEVLPLGPITRSRARKFREVLSLTCSKFSDSFEDISALDNKLFNVLHTDVSFQLNEADTPSASSFQLIEAPFSLTSALLAQLKLNNPEVAQREVKEYDVGNLRLARLKLGSSYAARFSSMKLTHLQLAQFSSFQLRSAQRQLY